MDCSLCGKKISKDEIGISKKLLQSDDRHCMCITCLSDYLDCEIEDLQVKICEFKEQGCTLFL